MRWSQHFSFTVALLSCLGPLREIDSDKDFGCFPKLYEVDNVLESAHRSAHVCHNFGPCECCKIADGEVE